ncbi:MAG: histidine kinase [Bacteroidales bacterium]|nr:histidine kinase [Bacteroidales bacterium]
MKKLKVILVHLFLWLLVFLTFFNIMDAFGGFPQKAGYNPYTDTGLYIRSGWVTFMLSIPFYFGYFITPYLFKRQKRKVFIIISVFFGVLFPLAMSIMDDGFRSSAIMQALFLFAFLNLFLILGASFRSIFGWIEQKKLHDQLEKQNLTSELNLMKVQLNPHFLFNTLHNIDTLIYDNQEKASKSLVKLSDIMRYMLQDAKSDVVELQKEIKHLENYLSLEQLRLKNEKFLKYNIVGNYKGIKIAPMVIIPFVENAFKHSVDSSIENGIQIEIRIENGILTFVCENQFDKSDTDKDKVHGIGLETVKKRLNLIYKNKHELSINSENSIFKVNLKIELNED